IEGDRETRTAVAQRLADQIRVLKGIDPTLGVYAAYAYADANLTDQTRSVRSFMQGDLGIDLFDVALLAGVGVGRKMRHTRCPRRALLPNADPGLAVAARQGRYAV